MPKRPQNKPHKWDQPDYGAKTQWLPNKIEYIYFHVSTQSMYKSW